MVPFFMEYHLTTEPPLVTSILITYNHKNSIAKALDSMLAQKTDFKHKILIEDDCSTDGTTQICCNYASRFPGKVEFSPKQENLGIVGNVYSGISKVDSEFYAVLEGDDYWCDDLKLQKQADALKANPDCSFCGHNTRFVGQDGLERPLFSSKKHNIREKYSFPKRFYSKRNIVKIHPSSRFYRTSCLDLNSLKYKDTVVWDSSSFWYFLSKGNFFYIDEIMSVYHYNGLGVFSGSSNIRQRYMATLNLMNINEEFNFIYNHVFMPSILKHRKSIGISFWDSLAFKYNLSANFNKYNQLKKRIESYLQYSTCKN